MEGKKIILQQSTVWANLNIEIRYLGHYSVTEYLDESILLYSVGLLLSERWSYFNLGRGIKALDGS